LIEDFMFHHVGIAVPALQPAIQSYENLFGYQLVSGPFDDPIQNVSVCFLSRGAADTLLELVAPLSNNSPVKRILKRGGGIYHVCYQVSNISVAVNRLIGQGSFLISGPVPAVAFEMREIAWLLTETSLLVELLQK
jgi:methylmalonyl-CoA epimerase